MTPVSPEQWQDAVDAAHHMLMFEMARLYDLIRGELPGTPEVDVARCTEIIEQGSARGIYPRVEAFARDKPITSAVFKARALFFFECQSCGDACVGLVSDPPFVHEGYCSEECTGTKV